MQENHAASAIVDAFTSYPVACQIPQFGEDYHRVTDSPDKINSEKESRILKLLFYLGQDIANASKRPAWKPESYREIVEDGED